MHGFRSCQPPENQALRRTDMTTTNHRRLFQGCFIAWFRARGGYRREELPQANG